MALTYQWGAVRSLPMPPPGLAPNPRWTVSPNQDGHLEVFALGADGAVWHIWETAPNSDVWSAWASLGAPPQGDLLGSPYSIAALQNQDGRVEIFLTDPQWNVWHIWQAAKNANWVTEWSSLGHPMNPQSSNDDFVMNVGIDNGGCIHVLMQDLGDGAGPVYARSQTVANGGWTNGWNSLGAPPAVLASVVFSSQDPSLFTRVYAQGENPGNSSAAVFRTQKSNFVVGSENWSGWEDVFNTPAGVPALSIEKCVCNQDKRVELFAFDSANGNLWHTWESNGNQWSGEWDSLGHAPNTSTSAFDVCIDQQGRITVASWQNDGFLYTIAQTAANNGWGGWYRIQSYNLSGFFAAEIRLVPEQNGLLSLFTRLAGNELVFLRQTVVNG